MPDVREVLKALSDEDKVIWQNARTKMRSTFIAAHGATVGSERWNENDDAFLDLIDIRLALLFDQAGRLNAPSEVVSETDAKPIEKEIVKAEDQIKLNRTNVEMSEASKKLNDLADMQNNSPNTPAKW